MRIVIATTHLNIWILFFHIFQCLTMRLLDIGSPENLLKESSNEIVGGGILVDWIRIYTKDIVNVIILTQLLEVGIRITSVQNQQFYILAFQHICQAVRIHRNELSFLVFSHEVGLLNLCLILIGRRSFMAVRRIPVFRSIAYQLFLHIGARFANIFRCIVARLLRTTSLD